MDKFFSVFGKLALVLLVVGILLLGGYYLGTGKLPFPSNPTPAAVTTTAPEATTTMSPVPTQTVSLGTTPKPTTTVKSGVTTGLSFSTYTIDVPSDWKVTQTHEDEPSPMDTLTLVKGAYSIKIFQAATGGAMCLYAGDPEFEGPSSKFDVFVPITTKDGVLLRRGGTTGGNGTTGGFTICQKGTENYGQPTSYGHISYSVPLPADETILKEMDAIIASLKKI